MWWRSDGVLMRGAPRGRFAEETSMLETLAVILVLMWLLGMVTSYTMSGFIHLLLLLALVVVVVRLLSGRRVLS